MTSHRSAPRRRLPGSPFNVPEVALPPLESFVLQDKVSHDTYGLGSVIGVEEGVAVLVDFGAVTRRIVAPYPKLFKL
ncbi:hypothetical protein FE391_11030 [Nonomuraea sp. KC401]|uniref:Uncharacterized protein n=2 Tax=Nonomuraea TaxID=83681 RepID=A0A4R4NJQ9_9ACTN|nr:MULTISPECIES: hypothetical protein [Nonomuraea]NBE92295.1 hypothetical protein [Nonomuraea sp. K271]TDC09339.1 hypothetical protein E1267_07605 [Nonomuraea longispora]TDE44557.1 hypothetical protein E1295_25175 [Nonomuraea mesophila]TLF77187.1 hypothetical protein FE391_11030 [Nonomuraea sp. KC401]